VDNTYLLARLQFHAAARPRYGYRRLHLLVEREGMHANHKRVHRVYRAGGLQVRRRTRKRLTGRERVPLATPTAPLERWSMDVMADTLADRRGFRTLNIVDDVSHVCPAIDVDRSLPGARVVRVLERLAETVGLPKVIVCDNGPEFAGRTLDAWAYQRGVELLHSARQAGRTRVRRELQWDMSRRVPERTLVSKHRRSQTDHRGLAH
jgi:putative transposase